MCNSKEDTVIIWDVKVYLTILFVYKSKKSLAIIHLFVGLQE